MTCTFSRDTLALHVEGDLPDAMAGAASRHLERCRECREFFQQLRDSQSLVKSLRREIVSPSECRGMRGDIMSILDRQNRLGWALRVERVTTLMFRRHAYALAACALVGVVSASVLAQMRHAPAPGTATSPVAVFEGADTLLRPDGYRAWILVSEPPERHPAGSRGHRTNPAPAHRVYIDPEGYRAYARTGTFVDGTVMVWESVPGEPEGAHHRHSSAPALLASVKDSSRFDGGWGFFDFAGQGRAGSKAGPSPESSGCRTCHLEEAATDSVFTQFYSTLRSDRRGHGRDETPARRATLTDSLAPPRRARHALAYS